MAAEKRLIGGSLIVLRFIAATLAAAVAGFTCAESRTGMANKRINAVKFPGQYGAKCDGATDDSAAFGRAFAAYPRGLRLELEVGKTCYVASDVTVKVSDLTITGGGTIHAAANVRALYLQSGAQRVRVQGISLKGTQGSATVRANIMIIENATDVLVDDND